MDTVLLIPSSSQLHEGVSILCQQTLSKSMILRYGPSSAAHHIGTCMKRSDTTSADWLQRESLITSH